MHKKVLGVLLSLIILLISGYFWYQSYIYVTTDNASVQAKSTLLSAKIPGLILQANVQENQKVKAGQVLVEINPEDYQLQLQQIESQHEAIATEVGGAERSYNRTVELFKKGAAAREHLDMAQTQFHSLQQRLKAVAAQVTLAKSNLASTKITAPADGTVGRKSFEVGMLANPGQPLFGFVEGTQRWIVANLKETDLDLITEGKKARITVDAITGREFEGEIESISPTTGATFSLLPPDNATGNFTKVVQRVPVRIKLLNLTALDIDRLQAGLSAEVKIRIH